MTFQNASEAARWWVDFGFWPVPIPSREKKPIIDKWQDLRINNSNLAQYFNGGKTNLGILLGDRYGSADVDLDSAEALSVAHFFLPPTGMIFGRQSKPASHWFYRTDPVVKTRQYKDPLTGQMLVELRGRRKSNGAVGLQTIVPPSVHPSGEAIMFAPSFDRTPANVDAEVIVNCVFRVAAASLLARYWPKLGSRHDSMMALAGILVRAKWPITDAELFCCALYRTVPSHDPSAIGRTADEVRDTYRNHAAGAETTGFNTLAKWIDPRVLRAALDWLQISTSHDEFEATPENSAEVGDWRDSLIRAETKEGQGAPKALLENAITALRLAPEWSGVLGYNEFSLYTVSRKPAPWQEKAGGNWTDYDDSMTCGWPQRNGILVNSKVTAEAAQTVAKENSFHPVRDYLSALKWDGIGRIEKWLTTYLGTEDTPFSRAVGARWLISAVARIMHPGSQVDHVLLVEGPQGVRKSTALRILASDNWFSDHISDLGSKDSRLELHGKWILELAELDKVRRGELERVKAFITARIDNFRVPYGRRSEAVPRSCVFAATVNDQTPLTDETGNRRFWPVRCGVIDLPSLERDRDQLWAEAYECYRSGSVWWLESAELNALASREQEKRYDEGVWDQVILAWLEEPIQRYEIDGAAQLPIEPFDSTAERVTTTDVLVHAVGKDIDRCTQADRNQVARCLAHAGWKRKQDRSRGPLRGKWFYFRPEEPVGTNTEPVGELDATC
jgi:predicted P-loop ATPase